MDTNKQYFIGSGLIALAMFFMACSIFIYMLFFSRKISTYALTENKAISVSIILPQKKVHSSTKKRHINLATHSISSLKPQPSIQSLFSNVWTKSLHAKRTKSDKKLDNKIIQVLSKKISLNKNKNDLKFIHQTVAIRKTVNDNKTLTTSSGQKVNKYKAKITAIVYNHFIPPANTQGQTAQVLLRLGANGMLLSYKVLVYSGNEMFNDEINRLQGVLMNVVFPKNPKGITSEYIVNLSAKEPIK